MRENIFFRVGYADFIKSKKEKWTSKLIRRILEHKIVCLLLTTIIVCTVTNCILIYRFIEKIQSL